MPLTNDMLRTAQLVEKNTRAQRTAVRERSYSDETVTPEIAITTSAVIAIITIMSQDIASIPLFLYARRGRSKFRAWDSPYYRLMHDQPNPEHTSMVFRELAMSHLIAWGNFYAQKIIDEAGDVVELWPLRPDVMTVKRFEGQRVYIYRGGEKERVFLHDEILHIPAFGFDGLVGYSRIALARNAIGISISTEKYGSKFFANGAQPGFVYKHPGELSDEAYDHLKESLEERKGVENSHMPLILEENMSIEKIGIPNDDAQFLETRNFQIQEINRFLGPVPPHRIADVDRSTSWGSGIDSQEQGYINHTIMPYGVRIEQSLNSQILSKKDREAGNFYEHLFDAFLRGDIQTRYESYVKAINNGIMTPNEVRAKENLNPYKDGDVFWRPLNMSPMNEPPADITQAQAALQPLWADTITRVLKREKNDLLGASKRFQGKGQSAAFESWVTAFYRTDQPAFMSKQFKPLLDAHLRLTGVDLSRVMDQHVFEMMQQRQNQVRGMSAAEIESHLENYVTDLGQAMLETVQLWFEKTGSAEEFEYE